MFRGFLFDIGLLEFVTTSPGREELYYILHLHVLRANLKGSIIEYKNMFSAGKNNIQSTPAPCHKRLDYVCNQSPNPFLFKERSSNPVWTGNSGRRTS